MDFAIHSLVSRDWTPSFSDHKGPILDHAQLHLVFWGTAWADAQAPSADDVTAAVQVILTSSLDGSDFGALVAGSPALGFIPKSDLSARAIEALLASAC